MLEDAITNQREAIETATALRLYQRRDRGLSAGTRGTNKIGIRHFTALASLVGVFSIVIGLWANLVGTLGSERRWG